MEEEKIEEKKEKMWDPWHPNCPKCGYPHAQPPECVACGEKIEEPPEKPEELEKPEGEAPEGEKPEDELLKKTRDELNALADEKGLDHGDYHNKEEIVNAILEAEE